MNYKDEIDKFYDWLETNQLPKSAIALWYALMHINSKAGWKNTFTVAISTIEFKTGFKRSELFEARNILQQKGRISWKGRGGSQSAEYQIIFFCVHNTDTSADAKAYANGNTNGYTNPTQMPTISTDTILTKQHTAAVVALFKNVIAGYSEDELQGEASKLLNKYPTADINNMGALVNKWAARMPKKEKREVVI
jgi:hypothetical protein